MDCADSIRGRVIRSQGVSQSFFQFGPQVFEQVRRILPVLKDFVVDRSFDIGVQAEPGNVLQTKIRVPVDQGRIQPWLKVTLTSTIRFQQIKCRTDLYVLQAFYSRLEPWIRMPFLKQPKIWDL